SAEPAPGRSVVRPTVVLTVTSFIDGRFPCWLTWKQPPEVGSGAMADAWFDELAEFLRIPSISADPAHAEDVRRAGDWVCDFVRGAGGTAELVDWDGHPLAIGEVRASSGAD